MNKQEIKEEMCYQLGTMKPIMEEKFEKTKMLKERTINLYSKSQVMLLIGSIDLMDI